MPKSLAETYFPVVLQALLAMGMAMGLLVASRVLGKRVRNRVKDMPYESGIVPTGDARERFSVKFYLVGMLFILFDVEAVFLYPWAIVQRSLKASGFGMFWFWEMLVYIGILLAGYWYVWKKGVLDWNKQSKAEKL